MRIAGRIFEIESIRINKKSPMQWHSCRGWRQWDERTNGKEQWNKTEIVSTWFVLEIRETIYRPDIACSPSHFSPNRSPTAIVPFRYDNNNYNSNMNNWNKIGWPMLLNAWDCDCNHCNLYRIQSIWLASDKRQATMTASMLIVFFLFRKRNISYSFFFHQNGLY